MKKILFTCICVVVSLVTYSSSYAASIENIVASNDSLVNATLSDDISLPKEKLDSDIKILKDLIVADVMKDSENTKKVTLSLTYALNQNNTYSLLGIMGSDINIDFDIGTEIPKEIVLQNDAVEKINVVDEKTLEIFYKSDMKDKKLVYKVLRDLGTKEVSLNKGFLNIFVTAPLEPFSSYILLVNSFKDADGKDVKFDEVFYEFITPEKLTSSATEEKEDHTKQTPNTEVKKDIKEDKSKNKKGNIEEVAMNSAKVPTTGAGAGIFILLAGIIAGFFFVKTRKK